MLSYRIALSRCASVNRARKENPLKCSRCEEGKDQIRSLIFVLKSTIKWLCTKKANLCTKCYSDYVHCDHFNPLPMRNAVEAFAICKVLKKPNLIYFFFIFYKAIVIIILCLNFICYLSLPLLMENVCFQILGSFRGEKEKPTSTMYEF